MLSTALSRQLNLRAPIFQAPMAGVSTPELVLAVGKAGALGAFGFAFTEPQAMKLAVEKVRAQADVPIHINLFVEPPAPRPTGEALHAAAALLRPAFEALKVEIPADLPPPYCPDVSAQIDTALALRPAVLSFHLNPFAPEVIREARRRGILVGGSATTLDEARAIEALGMDFIIAQGAEAGGHRGTFSGSPEAEPVGSLALTRLLVKRCRLPVVAAGGIMDGAGLAAVLALGAQAAQMGSAFVTTPESGAPSQHKKSMLDPEAQPTAITGVFSGRPARAIRNRLVEQGQRSGGPFLPFPAQLKLTMPLRLESSKAGTREYVAMWAGQAYPLAAAQSAADLVARCMNEAEEALAALRN